MHRFFRKIRRGIREDYRDINPEDIFIDSANLPGFNEDRFEGRIEKPISHATFIGFKIVTCLIVILLSFNLVIL